MERSACDCHSCGSRASARQIGVETQADPGWALLILAPFTSLAAAGLGMRNNMPPLSSFPAIGRYVYALPEVSVQPGEDANTSTVYFPAVAI